MTTLYVEYKTYGTAGRCHFVKTVTMEMLMLVVNLIKSYTQRLILSNAVCYEFIPESCQW